MTTSQHPAPPPNPCLPAGPTLARGAACLPCRRRKMRCDGRKPACSQCAAKGREEDCEYTADIQGLTKTQMLEENISILEQRIRELENPGDSSSVQLFNVRSAPSTSPVIQSVAPATADPTPQQTHNLINTFLPHAAQTGFFLHVPRFLQVSSLPAGSREPLAEPLITAVSLWGSRLSPHPTAKSFESRLLAKVVQEVSNSLFLAGNRAHGHAIVGVIQAEVLLANYFFSLGRFLEGKYHTSAATSLAVTCRLNTLGAPHAGGQPTLAMDLIHGPNLGLPALDAGDAIERGERINAFWAVYVLDKCWSVALGSPSSITDQSSSGMRIFTPWPLTMAQYAQGQMPVFNGQSTVTHFLNDASGYVGNASPFALRAKASTLFSQASVLAARYQPDTIDVTAYWAEFSRLDNLMTAFINNLPALPVVTPGDACELLVACTIARTAVIQLHIRFARENARSHDSCVAAATSILATIQHVDVHQLEFLDPIMAILFSAVCQVFLDELKTYGAQGSEYATGIRASLNQVLAAMDAFTTVCPLMASQAQHARESRGGQ